MDPHPSFQFGWENDENTYDQQGHGLLGLHSQTPTTSSVFGQQYQMPIAAHLANEVQVSNDTPMRNNEEEPQPAPLPHGAQPDTRFQSRGRSERLDWNAHKDMIRELYIDQNYSLPETMEAMRERYSFDAS